MAKREQHEGGESDETGAAGFARSLAARRLDVPYLSEVLAYEDAVRATLLNRLFEVAVTGTREMSVSLP